jgi:lipopolysaccharide biosynthesis glycosyltransferase
MKAKNEQKTKRKRQLENAIVLTFDDGYFDFAKVCLNSIKDNYLSHPIILAFYDGSDKNIINYLKSIGNLKVMLYERDYSYWIGLNMKRLNLGEINNKKVFFKYLAWSNQFDDYDKILYLDADTMILRPLDFMFEQDDFFSITDNSKLPYGIFYPDKFRNATLLKKLEQDRLSYPLAKDDMINAGVFVIPKKYRNKKNLNKLIQITYRYNEFMMFADQSAISLWCHYNKIKIHTLYQYNFQACFYFNNVSDIMECRDIHIVHFTWWKPEGNHFNLILNNSHRFIEISERYKSYCH